VLFVEDDELCREAVAAELSDHGFAVQSFADGAALLGALEAAAGAHVIILDRILPQTSGIDLLAELRRRGIDLPVVFLTGRSLIDHESLAFERGAIDFIDKTRGVEVLVRRLRLAVKAARPAVDSPSGSGWSTASSFSSRASAGPIGTSWMSALPSASTASSISWPRTSVAT
jgi:two-component system response regulator ChvI